MFNLSRSKRINFAKIYEEADDLLSAVPMVKKKRKRRKIFKFLKYFSYSILTLLLTLIIIFAAHCLTVKQIYEQAITGKNNLEQAVNLAKEQNFKQALISAKTANNNFQSSIIKLQEIDGNFLIAHVSFFKEQFSEIKYLLTTAEILSRAVEQGVNFAQGLEDLLGGEKKLSFSEFSQDEKRKILGRIYRSTPELTGMKANLDLALLYLHKVEYAGLLWPLKNEIQNLKKKLEAGQNILAKAIPMSQILPLLAGYPEKATYLVLLQNSNELRPTGGFIGTYGILELEYGEILRFDTHDIYHLDMPIKDKLNITPPEPLKEYLGIDKWFMRDANWSPDCPTAAQKIEWFYYKEDQLLPSKNQINKFDGEFNGVIAITPEFVTDLLAITGPVIIEGEEYNKNNFVDLLQYKVEKGYVQLGVPSWHRKEVIGKIIKKLKIKLFNLPSSHWREAINLVNNNIIKKNIFLFVHDTELQNLIKEKGWAGEIKNVVGDYLMVIDANTASLKTDKVMSKSISYKVEQGVNGLFAKLCINYAHHGNFDWETTRYRTYTRVYAPLNSQLIKADGLSDGEVSTQNELGKTVFGAFISIEPGRIGSLCFEYKLPNDLDELTKNGQYELYIQKQPGNKVSELIIDISFINKVKSYQPTGFYAEKIGDTGIRWESDLEMDRVFRVNF